MRSRRSTGRLTLAAGVLAGCAAVAGPAGLAAARPVALAIEPFAGVASLDSHLADYEWATAPRPVWGASLRADVARFGAGARAWTTGTEQRAAWPGEERSLDVRLRSLEGFAAIRVASLAGIGVAAVGHLGALHLGWSPDRLQLDGSGSAPLAVAFAPITEGIAGAGVEARRPLPSGFEMSLAVDRAWFRLDTSHRRGNEIVDARETFGNWLFTASITHPLLLR